MSDKARAETEGEPPSDSQEHESWLREAVHAPLATRIPKAGDVLGGRYRIEDVLGRGGMGVVFRARHVVSEKTVALKWMLRPTSDDQARKRFEREARAAGRIDHPNVVDLYDVGEEGECSYLVMELLRGLPLRQRLTQGVMEPRVAIELLIPAMRGVAAAHRAGVIHRDLKPDNIFLCHERENGQREVKVLDFGVSSITSLEAADSTLTQEGTLLGSLAYMSPEQLRNPHDVDARTDVYAFGVILFEVLSGELPFKGANQSALIIAVTTAAPKRLSELRAIPTELEDVVSRAMSRERSDRYGDMHALIEALHPFATPTQLDLRASANIPSSPGTKALPTPVVFADGGGRSGGARSPAMWIIAMAMTLIAIWLIASTWRAANPPVVTSSPPAEPVQVAVPKVGEAPPERVVPVSSEATVAPAIERVKARTKPKSSPATAHPRAEPKARASTKDSVDLQIEAKEKALFSGRK